MIKQTDSLKDSTLQEIKELVSKIAILLADVNMDTENINELDSNIKNLTLTRNILDSVILQLEYYNSELS